MRNQSPTYRFSTGLALCVIAPSLVGCQTWSGLGFGNPSRVPPPATGTYQPPISYYKGNAVSTNVTDVGPVAPISTGLPTATMTAGALPANPAVVPVSTAIPGATPGAVGMVPSTMPAAVAGAVPGSMPAVDVQSATFTQPAYATPNAPLPSDGLTTSLPAAITTAGGAPVPGAASASLSDVIPVEQPSLKWQQ